jgi:hypothetical protein
MPTGVAYFCSEPKYRVWVVMMIFGICNFTEIDILGDRNSWYWRKIGLVRSNNIWSNWKLIFKSSESMSYCFLREFFLHYIKKIHLLLIVLNLKPIAVGSPVRSTLASCHVIHIGYVTSNSSMANCNMPPYVPFSTWRLTTGYANPFREFHFQLIVVALFFRLGAMSDSQPKDIFTLNVIAQC